MVFFKVTQQLDSSAIKSIRQFVFYGIAGLLTLALPAYWVMPLLVSVILGEAFGAGADIVFVLSIAALCRVLYFMLFKLSVLPRQNNYDNSNIIIQWSNSNWINDFPRSSLFAQRRGIFPVSWTSVSTCNDLDSLYELLSFNFRNMMQSEERRV